MSRRKERDGRTRNIQEGWREEGGGTADHLVSEEKEKRGESQVEMAMGTLQKVMWNCPSLLMKWREEESLEMESSIRVRLAMWCPGEETASKVRQT